MELSQDEVVLASWYFLLRNFKGRDKNKLLADSLLAQSIPLPDDDEGWLAGVDLFGSELLELSQEWAMLITSRLLIRQRLFWKERLLHSTKWQKEWAVSKAAALLRAPGYRKELETIVVYKDPGSGPIQRVNRRILRQRRRQ